MTSHPDPYEAIAGEYYDRRRHPTSANFREASALLLERWLPGIVSPGSRIAEIGSGDSLMLEVATRLQLPLGRVSLVDSSPTMLRYSEHWRSPQVELILADAESLPFDTRSLDLVVSVLGDPYNTARFWSETARTLTRGGRAVYTTPSHEWSIAFRGELERAVFDRSDGDELAVESVVLSRPEQRAIMQAAGLVVSTEADVALGELTGPRSPKLRVLTSELSPVVTGYLVTLGL